MPPKRRKGDAAAAAAAKQQQDAVDADALAAAAATAGASPPPPPPIEVQLTPDGIESLRSLARHRPQRLALGGVALLQSGIAGGAGASAAAPPAPEPVTLQIISVHRYFIDHRFWSLVGVPLPTLPAAASSLPYGAAAQQQLQLQANGNGNGNGMEDVSVAGGVGAGGAVAGAGPASSSSAPSAAAPFDEYSDLHVAYDLLLSDGVHQLKTLLSPTLSLLVEKGGILPSGVLRVKEAGWRFDETVVNHPGFIVLKSVEVVQAEVGNLLLADASTPLSYPAWVDPESQRDKPLVGGPRSYYLALFNDDTLQFEAGNYPVRTDAERIDAEQRLMHLAVEGEERKDGGGAAGGKSAAPLARLGPAPQQPLAMQDIVLREPDVLQPGDTVTIRRLLREGVGYQPGDLHILGRVFAKSRIFVFGRKSASSSLSSRGAGAAELARAPFSFELLLGDSSDEQIKVTLWNTLVGTYFSRVHVGQIVAVRGFRLKKARQDGQLELALNPYNPQGSLRVFDSPAGVDPSLWAKVPAISMTVSTIASTPSLPEGSMLDVAGVVSYAGPMRREWSAAKKSFFQYRWILLTDPSSLRALAMKLFTNSQQEELDSVREGDVVYVSNLVLHSSVAGGAGMGVLGADGAEASAAAAALSSASLPSSRSLIACSTHYTQILREDAMVRSGHPYLQALLRWAQNEADHSLLRAYPSSYQWNLDWGAYTRAFGGRITPLSELPLLLEALRFQQVRGVLLQATIAEIILHPAALRPIHAGVMDQESYEEATRRLQQDSQELLKLEAAEAAVTAATAADAAPAAAAKSKKGRARFAKKSATAAASPVRSPPARAEEEEEAPPNSQASTLSSRLRRSTRTQSQTAEQLAAATAGEGKKRGGRGRAASAMAASRRRSASEGRASSRGRSKSQTQGRSTRAAAAAAVDAEAAGAAAETTSPKHRRARSATPVRRQGKLVKIVQRKRKAHPTEEEGGEQQAGAGGAAAGTVASAAAAAPVAPAPAAVAFPPVPLLPALTPSSPSVLATLVLRDLNGETLVHVELTDPLLGHVDADKAGGSVAASAAVTPREAPRIFLGLARVMPAAAFPPAAWAALIQQASGVEREAAAAASPAAASAAPVASPAVSSAVDSAAAPASSQESTSSRRRGRGAAAASAASAAATSPASSPAAAAAAVSAAAAAALTRRAAIAQLHGALLAALSPLRLVCSALITRTSFTQTQATLTGVFAAQPL